MQPLPKFLRQTQAWSAQWAQLAELLFTFSGFLYAKTFLFQNP
jgi:hypothetical protein